MNTSQRQSQVWMPSMLIEVLYLLIAEVSNREHLVLPATGGLGRQEGGDGRADLVPGEVSTCFLKML